MKQFVLELAQKVSEIENEKKLLSQQMKDTLEEYTDKLDVTAFKAALRIAKIKSTYRGSDDELENILEALNVSID